MANTVGACKVNVESYKCSIKKITVSTKWKAPTAEIPEQVTTTVFDKQWAKWGGKSIYLISSPEGKDVTIKTERENGKCPRDNHRKYVMSKGISKDNTQVISQTPISPVGLSSPNPVSQVTPIRNVKSQSTTNQSTTNPAQANQNSTYQNKGTDIKAEEKLKINCFEISDVIEAIKYCLLPIPASKVKNSTTNFKYVSCNEGSFQYSIIPYPDITFKLELSIGTKETKKKQGGFSHLERNATKLNRTDDQLGELMGDANTDLKFSPPKINALTTFNGKKDELEVNIDFDTDEEIINCRYKHDAKELEVGSEGIQFLFISYNKFFDLVKFLAKVCNGEFIQGFIGFDAKSLTQSYKPYKWKLSPPSISISFEGQYHTSKDLLKIGKLFDVCLACKPLIELSLTVDLLFLILSAVSAGTATGFYVMLKNLDKVIGKILGDDYKKAYKDTKPFEADVYFNLVLSGAINGSVHWLIDTTQEANSNSKLSSIEGIIKVDLEAGAKVSLDVFIVAVEGEASASGSTGIKIKVNTEQNGQQEKGIPIIVEGYFLGIKIKYCIKGKVALMKTASAGGSLVDGETKLLDTTQIFSKQWVLFDEKA